MDDYYLYKGKDLLAWLVVDENADNNRRLYAYPQYEVSNNYELIKIDNDSSLDKRITITITASANKTASDLVKEHRFLALLHFNEEPSIVGSIKYNPSLSKSDVKINHFTWKGFVQIISTDDPFEVHGNLQAKSIDVSSTDLFANEIVVEYDDKFYGSFGYENEQDSKIRLRGKKESKYFIGIYSLSDLQKESIIEILGNQGETVARFIHNKSIPPPLENRIDWMDNDQLSDDFILPLLKETHSKSDIRKIRNSIKNLVKLQEEDELWTKARKLRAAELLEGMDDLHGSIRSIIHYLLDNPEENKGLIDKLVDKVYEKYYDEIKTNFKNIADVEKIESDANSKKEEIKNLIAEIEKLQNDKSSLADEAMHRSQQENLELEESISALKKEKNELIEYIGKAKEIKELNQDIEQLRKSRELANTAYNQMVIDQNSIEKKMNDTITNYENQESLLARVLDNKLLNQVLRGVSDKDATDPVYKGFDSQLLLQSNIEGKDIIDKVETYLKDEAKREFERNDVVNFLVCITQGFITTFAGEPGSGKTSLCNILAKALGLSRNDEHSRFTEVSVERGWSSHKDFIGYYNPLTKTMERSNDRVFDAFYKLNKESIEGTSDAPYFILLDEANLSPIEHYWAVFLKMCDFDVRNDRVINLGGKHYWNVPENLRFLATVNFDHTTEELSQRFIDRSWIIMLKPSTVGDEILEDSSVNQDEIIPFSAMKKFFAANTEEKMKDDIKNQWIMIQDIFANNNSPIMPRNQNMVQRYCVVAEKYMDKSDINNRFAPLDYAIAQKILPTINGTEKQYKKLLEDLLKECSDLPISKEHIQRIINNAEENHGFYQFFSK